MVFQVGTTFESLSDLEDGLNDYSQLELANFFKKNNCLLVPNAKTNITRVDVEKFRYQRLYLKCKYSGEPQVKKTTRHLRQTSSYKSGCKAMITVKYDAALRKFKVTALQNDHNHPRSVQIYQCLPKQRSLRDEEKEFVTEAVKMKANPRLVQSQVKEKFGKTVILKDIHNVNARIKMGENKTIDRSVLEEIHADLEKYDGIVADIMLSEETNTLEGIFIQDQRMQNYFERYPEVVIMDATYKLNDRRMPLFVMVIIDGNGESQIGALFLLKSENYLIVKQMLEKFKSLNPAHEKIKTVLSDKSFADRKAYAECFPNAQLQLCIFHVIQAWIREISASKMNISGAEKKEVLQTMQNMLYARTESKYLEAYNQIQFPCVKDYFDKNWHPLEDRKQWATYLTDNMQNYLSRTTNRIESINQKLKTVVTRYGKLNSFLKETMQCIHSLNIERDYRTITQLQKKPITAVKETDMEFKYRSILTSFAYTAFLTEMENYGDIEDVGVGEGHLALKNRANSRNVILVNDKSCGCRFHRSMALPCRHIIYFLRSKGMDPFAANLCHNRWLKKHLPADLIGEAQMATPVLSQAEKYRKVHEVTEKIAEMVSEKPSAIFTTFLNALNDCVEAIANNNIFAVELINENGNHQIHFLDSGSNLAEKFILYIFSAK